MARKVRLDLHLLTKGIANTRQKAIQLIRAGKVKSIDGQLLDKPGKEVNDDLELIVKNFPRFVSRGGEKLIAAFDNFSIDVENRICLDCGISTGGFTDCLLQKGASRIYGVDVGYGQTAWSLRNDKRVVLKERTNIRNLTVENLYGLNSEKASFFVADLSFISLTIVLPSIKKLLSSFSKEGVVLVKPQFEVGREKVGKKGVVRDPNSHEDAIKKVINSSILLGWQPKGLIASPITGAAGNHEYLLWIGSEDSGKLPDIKELVSKTLT
tara:strand:+ start:13543 stop:14346 length:804 start_codon:yes stop_codon:yes gene_type:complete